MLEDMTMPSNTQREYTRIAKSFAVFLGQSPNTRPLTMSGASSPVTDTLGNLVGLVIHPANVQDRDGAPAVLKSIRKKYPSLRHVFADGGYAGPKLQRRLEKIGKWTIQIVKRSDTAEGFELLPRRWAEAAKVPPA